MKRIREERPKVVQHLGFTCRGCRTRVKDREASVKIVSMLYSSIYIAVRASVEVSCPICRLIDHLILNDLK